MSFLSRIFGIKRTVPQKKAEVPTHAQNPRISEIYEINNFINKLLSSDSYIAKSDYLKKLDSSKNAIHYFQQLKKIIYFLISAKIIPFLIQTCFPSFKSIQTSRILFLATTKTISRRG